MSMFLGPIHYVMYERIKIVNNREKGIIKAAEEEWGAKAKDIITKASEKFGCTCQDTPLEEQIGNEPIHNWLSNLLDRVVVSESAVVAGIIGEFKDGGEKLIIKQAYDNARALSESLLAKKEGIKNDIVSLRNLLFTYMLEGMPCDHTSETINVTDNSFVIERDLLTNAENWLEGSAPTDFMIQLNSSWIKGFIEGFGSFSFERERVSKDGALCWVDTVSAK